MPRADGTQQRPQPTLPADAELVLPERVTIALGELAGAAREGLLALAVGTGIAVLGELLAGDVQRLVGPKDRSYPGAAASLREGLPETLTIARPGVPPTVARTLRSTNSIESMIAICRDHAANARALARRADGAALGRAGMGRAAKQFRRVNGHLHLAALRAEGDQTVPAVTPSKEDAA